MLRILFCTIVLCIIAYKRIVKKKFCQYGALKQTTNQRMDEYCMARRVLTVEASGGRVRGRPRLGWMDGLKVALGPWATEE